MSHAKPLSHRILNGAGLICLVATLVLMSLGVRAVRADDAALMSTDPVLEDAARTQPPAAAEMPLRPAVKVSEAEKARRPGVPAIEVRPGVIVLNTRGFNYGPPPTEIDPAAMRAENATQ